MTNTQIMTRKDLEARLVAKAWEDEVFKQKLISNPKAAIEQELGQKVSDSLEFRVLEETGSTVYIIIPKPATEISEEQLNAVAGGTKIAAQLGPFGGSYDNDVDKQLDLQRDVLKATSVLKK